MSRAQEIKQRRLELQMRAAWQRSELAAVMDDLQHSLDRIDRVIASVRRFATSPVAIAASLAALILLRPSRLLRWGSRLGMFVGVYRRLQRWHVSRSAET